jgi:hypothetical protein
VDNYVYNSLTTELTINVVYSFFLAPVLIAGNNLLTINKLLKNIEAAGNLPGGLNVHAGLVHNQSLSSAFIDISSLASDIFY